MMNLRPTLQEIVPGYTAVGFPKIASVRMIIGDHMRSNTARGKGSKAMRRELRILKSKLERIYAKR